MPGARISRPTRLSAAPAAAALIVLLVLAVLAVLAVLWLASPAYAHDELQATDPADGSTAAALPAQLTLTFSGELLTEEGATQVQVTDAAGTSLSAGAPVVAGTVVTQPLAAASDPGAVRVLWRVVSSDGHPISGEFGFTVTPPTPTATSLTPAESPSPTLSSVPADQPEDPLMNAIDMRPWFIGGALLAAAAGGAIVYLLVRRARSGPGSGGAADR